MPYIPPGRPMEEWEHVHVTKGGRRFVEIDELLASEDVIDIIREVASLTNDVDVQDPAQEAASEHD